MYIRYLKYKVLQKDVRITPYKITGKIKRRVLPWLYKIVWFIGWRSSRSSSRQQRSASSVSIFIIREVCSSLIFAVDKWRRVGIIFRTWYKTDIDSSVNNTCEIEYGKVVSVDGNARGTNHTNSTQPYIPIICIISACDLVCQGENNGLRRDHECIRRGHGWRIHRSMGRYERFRIFASKFIIAWKKIWIMDLKTERCVHSASMEGAIKIKKNDLFPAVSWFLEPAHIVFDWFLRAIRFSAYLCLNCPMEKALVWGVVPT